MNNSSDDTKMTHQEPAKAMAEGRVQEFMGATGVKMKKQGNGTGGSPVHIEFSHSA